MPDEQCHGEVRIAQRLLQLSRMGYKSQTKSLLFHSSPHHTQLTQLPSQTNQLPLPNHPSANMQFSKIFLVAATVASAAAAPTGELETRTAAPIKCQHHGGKWKYGWEGAADNEKYTCNTAGLLVSYQSLAWDVPSVLTSMASRSERPDLCQHPQRQHR